MRHLSRVLLGCLTALSLVVPVWAGEEPEKHSVKRGDIDTMAQQTLDRLLEENPAAKKLYADAYGWAVFDNMKFAFLLSGGGGSGVAVEKAGNARTYMKMGTAGVGLGLGGQKYQVVFLFENEKVFRSFVDKGWKADTAAQAAAGTAGASAASTFNHGVAIYQFTDKGLMALADVAGTKYWKNKKLNL
jgi:lipid-binding SYLF domain-containing protein